MADWSKLIDYAKKALGFADEIGDVVDAVTKNEKPDWSAGGKALIDLAANVGADKAMDELLAGCSPSGCSWWAHGSSAGLTDEDGNPMMAPAGLQAFAKASDQNRQDLVAFAEYVILHAKDVGSREIIELVSPYTDKWLGGKDAEKEAA